LAGSGDRSDDSISLAFAKVEFDYKPQDEKGRAKPSVKGGWDLTSNKKT
jgi:type VI protein secretion system component Hcp